MMREYVFDKKITEDMCNKILSDAKEIKEVEKIEITEDKKHIIVGAEDKEYPTLMPKILNIYCKYSGGTLVSFCRFI